MNDSDTFYANKAALDVPLGILYDDEKHFDPLPKDWSVLVADVKNSTLAVSKNLHNEVNLAATGSIVAVLNSLKESGSNIQIPYFFGGDGATFLIPSVLEYQLLRVMEIHKRHVQSQWSLELVIGLIPIEQVYEDGFGLKVAKVKLNSSLIIPIVLGTGLKYAEGLVKKSNDVGAANAKPDLPNIANLTGMECRWDTIAPPASNESIMCLLVYCSDEIRQRSVYTDVLSKLAEVFGNLEERIPISIANLRLDTTLNKIKREMFAAIGRYSYRYLIRAWLITTLGRFYLKYSKEGRSYLEQIKELSDTIMIDGMINTIVSGTEEQLNSYRSFLDTLEHKGDVVYGVHITDASVMSCYVEDRKNKHIHFIDGAKGGYTQAAEMLKAKMRR